jgi:hypothetical protein
MFGTTRGTLVPASKVLLAFTVALTLGAPLCARADDGMVDVRTLPRLEGAAPDQSERERYPELSFTYKIPGTLTDTIAAIRKLLAADGWTQYAIPFQDSPRIGAFKKGPYGVRLFYMTGGSRTDRSAVNYGADRL